MFNYFYNLGVFIIEKKIITVFFFIQESETGIIMYVN